MRGTTITSVSNPRIKEAAKLRDRRQRERQGRFAIDGARELLRAVGAGVRIVEAFVCPELCAGPEGQQAAAALDGGVRDCWQVTPEVFAKLAYGQRLEGVLAIAEATRPRLSDLRVASGTLIAVVAGLEKPGNVGAVLRSADAAGVAAVIVADPQTDLCNPNCIRASLGTIFTMPVAQATADEALAWLRERGARMLAARVDAERLYTDVDWRGDVAVVLGSEATGLSAEWQAGDVVPIKLPMRGAADSLNVSATAAVLFYEALRQRESK
jgi:TrmH family RNA methyltransferase